MFVKNTSVLKKNRNKIFEDTCWVYVRREREYIIAITYDEDFHKRETTTGHPILLWRKFDDTLSAAGYRIILKNLSTEALEKVLKEHSMLIECKKDE